MDFVGTTGKVIGYGVVILLIILLIEWLFKKKKNKSYPYLESLLSTVLGVNSIYDSIRADGKKWKSNMIDR